LDAAKLLHVLQHQLEGNINSYAAANGLPTDLFWGNTSDNNDGGNGGNNKADDNNDMKDNQDNSGGSGSDSRGTEISNGKSSNSK
jgi:hypothetical protein